MRTTSMHNNATTSPFDAPMVTPEVKPSRPIWPRVQWSSGKEMVFLEKTIIEFVGARVEVGICPTFDEIARRLKWKKITIDHLRSDSAPEPHEHWVLPTSDLGGVTLFPYLSGTEARTFSELSRIQEKANKWGIRAEWRATKAPDNTERVRSYLQFLVFQKEMLQEGYPYPLIVSASGLLTDHFVGAIAAHVELVERLQATMPESSLRPVHVGMVLASGVRTRVGKGLSSVIVPPKLVIPEQLNQLPMLDFELVNVDAWKQHWLEWINYLTALRSLSEETN